METLTFKTPDNNEFIINTPKTYGFETKEVIKLDEEHLCFLAELLVNNQDGLKMFMETISEAMSLIVVDILETGLSETEKTKVTGTLVGLGTAYKQLQDIQ